MKANKQKYSLDQCTLYKCRSRKKLESILAIEQGDLRNIQSAIKYSSFEIDKKDSSEKRTITAPKRTIKAVQARILTLIQRIERPEWLISGEKGKCYIDNGKAHIGSAYVLTIDIKKFYDNCRREYVYRFFLDKMQTAPDVAKILTDIVTYKGGIPTGCPTSQLIAYYAYEDMFKQIQACAESYGCIFTLYVDDMTFSSKDPFPQEKLSREIDIILRRYGHKPKYKKVVFYAKEKPKPITGTIVTSDHELEVPIRLQEKIYNGFQGIKQLSEQNDFKQIDQAARILLGQVQAAKSIGNKKFPEIERLTKEIRNIQEPQRDFKPKPPHRRKVKGKIHISKPRTN